VEAPQTRYVDRDGVKIAWQVFGDGPAEILFVPGWVTNVDLFWHYPGEDRGTHRLKGIPDDWQLYALA
jgi:hypothetical protein